MQQHALDAGAAHVSNHATQIQPGTLPTTTQIPGDEMQRRSPYKVRRADVNFSPQSNASSSRTQYEIANHGNKQYPRKFSDSFRQPDAFYGMQNFMPNEFHQPGVQKFGKHIKKGDRQVCLNSDITQDRYTYTPCGCFQCTLRNRSVWVRVADRKDMSIMEVQTKVRYGIEQRFGRVEDVNPAAVFAPKPGMPHLNFILR